MDFDSAGFVLGSIFMLGLAVFVVAEGVIAINTLNASVEHEKQLEQACHDYATVHGYEFVKYHHATLGSPEECWGSKNGVSVRLY